MIKKQPTTSRSRTLAATLLAAMLVAGQSAQAATDTWVGNTDTDLATAANWDTTVAPVAADSLVFGTAGTSGTTLTNTLTAGLSLASLTFNSGASAFTLGGNQLTLTSGITNNATNTETISLALALGGSNTWSVASGGNLSVSGIVSGANSLTKTGAGTLTLSGVNTYSGGTTLSAGTLLVQGSSTPTSGTVTSGPLGTGTLTLNGGTFGFVSGASYTIANNVSVGGATNIQVASGTNEVLNGNWSGSGNLTLVSNGTTGIWQFGGDNSGYTGSFTQNSGNTSLAFNNQNAGSASAAWTFNNPTAQRTRLNFGAGTINFGSMAGNGSIANIAGSGLSTMSVGALNTSTTFSGKIGEGTGQALNIALTKVGTGTLTLSGTNAYTGGTTISAGTLALGSASTLTSATGALTVNGGTLSSTVASTTLGGNLTLSGGSLLANGTSAGTIVLAANKNFSMTSGTFSYSLNDAVTGSGTGTFSLTGGTFDLTSSITDYSITYSVFSGFTSGTVSGLSFTNYDSSNYLASLSTAGVLSFSAIPEPATYATLFGGLALVGAVVHRRRRTLNGS